MQVRQTELVKDLHGPAAPLGTQALQFQYELHILAGREHGNEIVRLEHEAQRVQAQVGPLSSGQRRYILPQHG